MLSIKGLAVTVIKTTLQTFYVFYFAKRVKMLTVRQGSLFIKEQLVV